MKYTSKDHRNKRDHRAFQVNSYKNFAAISDTRKIVQSIQYICLRAKNLVKLSANIPIFLLSVSLSAPVLPYFFILFLTSIANHNRDLLWRVLPKCLKKVRALEEYEIIILYFLH